MTVNDAFCGQVERLVLLSEECAEVTQAVAKILRFGMNGGYNGVNNKERLQQELIDLVTIINLMMSANDIELDFEKGSVEKLKKLAEYTRLQQDVIKGMLNE